MELEVTRSLTSPRLWHRVLAATASLGLAAAALSPSAGMAQGALNVAFLPKAVNNPYFDTAARGGQKARQTAGFSSNNDRNTTMPSVIDVFSFRSSGTQLW